MKITKTTNHGNTRWILDGTLDGHRKRFFFASKGEAEREMERLERERTQQGRAWLAISDAERVQMCEALRRANCHGYTLMEACDSIERSRSQHDIKPVAIVKALGEFLDNKRAQNLKPYTLELMAASLWKLADKFPDRPVSSLTLRDVEAYLKHRGGSPKSRKNYLGELSGFLRWCVNRGYAAKNHCEVIPVPIIERPRPRSLTAEDSRKLLDTCREHDPELLALMTICLFGGLRTGECKRLEWGDIDLDGGVIHVSERIAKTRQHRTVPIPENMRAWLKLGGQLPLDRVDDRIIAVRKKAGVKQWQRNAMRHTFCSMHLALHESAAKTALIAGHSDPRQLPVARRLWISDSLQVSTD
jgi:integrase